MGNHNFVGKKRYVHSTDICSFERAGRSVTDRMEVGMGNLARLMLVALYAGFIIKMHFELVKRP